jgi:hypothetical protein
MASFSFPSDIYLFQMSYLIILESYYLSNMKMIQKKNYVKSFVF